MKETFERIENNRWEKLIKTLKILSILSLLIAIVLLLMSPEILKGKASFADLITMLMPIGFYLNYRGFARKWNGQFIEWQNDSISFKGRATITTTLLMEEIQSLEIEMDRIIIHLKNSNNITLDIQDFTEYKDRIRIKENFEKIKNTKANNG